MMKTKKKTYPPEPLAPNEVKSLLAACSPRSATGLRNRALIVVLWRAGLRSAEARGLEPRDLDNGVVHVRCGKGSKSRVVAVDPEAWAVLRTWMDCKAQLGIGGPVFSTLAGKPLLASYCRNLFKRLGRRAGLGKRIHQHGLRHSFAAGLADEKVDLRIISKALGHSNLSTTQTYVDHLRPTAVIDVLKARAWG